MTKPSKFVYMCIGPDTVLSEGASLSKAYATYKEEVDETIPPEECTFYKAFEVQITVKPVEICEIEEIKETR